MIEYARASTSYLDILHFAKLVVKGKSDAFMKIAWVLGFGKPDTHFGLQWTREGTSQLIMGTKLALDQKMGP